MPIEFKNVTHTYAPGTPLACRAIDDVSLCVPDGSFFAIVGKTGSGKSTLLQMMNGLIIPKIGSVSIDGIPTTSLKGEALRRIRTGVGVVFQYPEHQLFEETIALDVAFGPSNFGHTGQELDDIIDAALLAVGLDPGQYRPRSPQELSGGEMRRVAIAGVLAMKPNYLVLDEPTAGLDPKGSRDLLDLLSDLHNNRLTVVIVTHNLDDVAERCDRIVGLSGGSKAVDSTPRAFLSNIGLIAGMGLLPTEPVLVIEDLRSKGFHVKGQPITAEECAKDIMGSFPRCLFDV